MILHRIVLKHFKNQTDLDCELSPLVLVSGNNGSGKTSILQAIRLCLTDSLPEKLSEYIQWGQTDFSIKLFFEVNKVQYEYSYRYGSSSNKQLKYTIDGVDHLDKGSDAVDKIREFVNPDLLLYSSISEQGKSYALLDETPAKRSERFKKLLGMDRLLKVIELAKQQLSILKTNLKVLEKELEGLESARFEFIDLPVLPNIDQIKSEFQIQKESKIEKENYIKAKEEWDRVNETYSKQLKRKEELEVLISNLKQKSFEKITTEFNQSDLDTLYIQKEEQLKAIQKYNDEKKDYDFYCKEINTINTSIESLKLKLGSLKVVRVEELNHTVEDLKPFESEEMDLILKDKELVNHLKLAKEGKCQTCGQDFIHSVDKIEADIKSTSERLKEVRSIITTRRAELQEYLEKIRVNEDTSRKIEDVNKEIKSLEDSIKKIPVVQEPAEIPNNLAYIETKIEEQKKLKKEYETQLESIKEFEIQMSKYQGELESIELTPPGQPIQPRRFAYREEVYEDLQKQINIYDEKVEEINRVEKLNEKTRIDRENNKLAVKQKQDEIFSTMGEIKDTEDSRVVLEKLFANFLIDKGTSFVESKMNMFFQLCYPKYSVYFTQTEDKKSIDFLYSDLESEIISPVSLCSGFEKQLVSVAFRVALASITGIGFLILDEVDSDASEENSIILYSNLIDSKLFSQLISITHKYDTRKHLIDNYGAEVIEL